MATVLIMYYKQLSEGYDDKRNFSIMRKVGLEKAEIRRSVRSQVLIMFYLPLITACVHIAFAFPFIMRLLPLVGITDVGLFAVCTLVSVVVFAVIYAASYALTRPHLLPHRRLGRLIRFICRKEARPCVGSP